MKPIKLAFLLAISYQLLFIKPCSAQSFSLLKATSQHWSGGVVGHYGVNYFIEIETSSRRITPDTIWIDGFVYPMNFSVNDGRFIRTIDSVTHQIKFRILVSESHMDFRRPPNLPADTTAEKPKHLRTFSGAALISYTLKHKEHFYTIKSFTRLTQLNYP